MRLSASSLAAVFFCGFALLIAEVRTENDRLRAENAVNENLELAPDFLRVPRSTHLLYRITFRDPWPLYGEKIASEITHR